MTLAVGLLAATGLVASAQSPAGAQAELVTGEYIPVDPLEFTETSEADGVLRERNRVGRGRIEMSDPRLSGDAVSIDNADRFCDGPCGPDTFRADLLWGTFEIVNDGGSWTGTSVGTTDLSADGAGIGYFALTGSGGYEGLSAILFQPEIFDQVARRGTFPMNGVIFPGNLPPDR
jgi:hypothetical protein